MRECLADDEQGEPELISSDTACLAIKQFLKEQSANAEQPTSAFPTQSPEDEGDDHNHNQVLRLLCVCGWALFGIVPVCS